jgi:hypothetical protein
MAYRKILNLKMKVEIPGIFLFFALLAQPVVAQETETIRVRRESNLAKAVFDNTEMRLLVVDRFGNPRENKIAGYKFFVKTRRETREFEGYGNNLSPEMINYLNRQTRASKIFFTEISAKDDNDHLVKLPDVIETWFPDCANCEKGSRKK